VNLVEVEDASKRAFDLAIDGEPISQVTKMRIFPAPDACQPPSADGVGKSCEFPVMTFLPEV